MLAQDVLSPRSHSILARYNYVQLVMLHRLSPSLYQFIGHLLSLEKSNINAFP